jgi:hypothetical protein
MTGGIYWRSISRGSPAVSAGVRSQQRQSGPTGRQSPFAVHPVDRPAGCRADYQSGVKTRGNGSSRYSRPPESSTPVKEAA